MKTLTKYMALACMTLTSQFVIAEEYTVVADELYVSNESHTMIHDSLFNMIPEDGYVTSNNTAILGNDGIVVAHGGGCRKSSPPGKCCHMDNSTGIVHCH
ncbi:MAG: hypothetical protein L3J00_06280 [Thiomicrorhabdus sp.]|nr:hypothetical protein [Thiomicrorhabdus sp.]